MKITTRKIGGGSTRHRTIPVKCKGCNRSLGKNSNHEICGRCKKRRG